MSEGIPFRPVAALGAGRLAGFSLLGILLSSGMQYLWLVSGTPLVFRIWGFTLLPAYLVTLLPALALVRPSLSDFPSIRALLGSVTDWIFAVLAPVAVFLCVWQVFVMSGGDFDPSWKWITLAISAMLDLPLSVLWVLPMTAAQDMTWRVPFDLASASRGESLRNGLVSALAWTAAHAVFVWQAGVHANLAFAGAVAAMIFAAGFFAYQLQRGGALLPSASSMVLLATLSILLCGSDVPELNHILLGYDVDAIEPGLTKNIAANTSYLGAAAAAITLTAFLIPRKKARA